MRHRSRTLLTVQTVRTAITSITIAYLDRFEAKMAELSQMLAALKRSLAAEPSLHRKKPKRCPSVHCWFHEMARSAGTRMTPKCRVPARWSAPIGLLLPSQQCGPGQHEPRSCGLAAIQSACAQTMSSRSNSAIAARMFISLTRRSAASSGPIGRSSTPRWHRLALSRLGHQPSKSRAAAEPR